jgi:hypothetical protein
MDAAVEMSARRASRIVDRSIAVGFPRNGGANGSVATNVTLLIQKILIQLTAISLASE